MSNDDMHMRIGAYVVDALPDDERDEFELHLDGCQACRQEVRGLTEAAGELGAATSTPVPEGLRDQVMRRVTTVRQLPPPVAAAKARSRWFPRLTAMAAAACLVVAVVFGALLVQADNRADQLEAQQRQVESVLSAPDVAVTTGTRTAHGTGTLAASRDRDRVVFTLDRAKQLPREKTYQLWFIGGDGTARSAGLLSGRDPSTTIVAGSLSNARQVGVTVEPAGGSRQPTTTPVLQLAVP